MEFPIAVLLTKGDMSPSPIPTASQSPSPIAAQDALHTAQVISILHSWWEVVDSPGGGGVNRNRFLFMEIDQAGAITINPSPSLFLKDILL